MDQTGGQLPSINDPDVSLSQQQINQTNIPVPTPPKLPCRDLIAGPREEYLKIGVPLYEACVKGDWRAAKAIFDGRPELVRYSITENDETTLHVAASAKISKKVEEFVENLVRLMTKEDLALENRNYSTALYLAAAAGNLKPVKVMVEKNRALMEIPGGGGKMMPLYVAVLFGKYEVVKYLFDQSHGLRDDCWTDQYRGWLLEKCVEGNMFDVALQIWQAYPNLVGGVVLAVLAGKPDAFSGRKSSIFRRSIYSVVDDEALQLLRMVWKDISKKPKMDIDNILRGRRDPIKKTSSSRILFIAAEMGNTEFIVELIRGYPDLIWKVNDHNQSIFHVAVKHRHHGIYNLLYEIGSMKDLITPLKDEDYNNMLHIAGTCAKKKRLEDVSGPALQMQRELLWFQEVERMIPPSYRQRQNKDGLTPQELFSEEHKDLIAQGEKWMKGTASQCMVVAALIATIVFAATFMVPGGYNQNDGIPFFYQDPTFIVFVVADAISLFFSAASILTFLSILTSRYAERDFVASLPMKLMLGLITLILSITTMVVAFSISFFVLYHKGMIWIAILMAVFAIFPVLLYVVMQYHMLIDVIRSTYGSKYLFKPKKHVLYYQNPKV